MDESRRILDAVEKVEIAEAIHRERIARDTADWATMASYYPPSSTVKLSWFNGSGPDFVEGSRKQVAAGVIGLHKLGVTIVDLNGVKALARHMCEITLLSPVTIGGVEVEVCAVVRLNYRMIRIGGRWTVNHLTCIYIKDTAIPGILGEQMRVDRARLNSFRPSYRYLSYMMEEAGIPVANDLPGMDEPETVAALKAADDEWLRG